MALSIFKDLPAEHPRKLIPELCRQFYHLGWVTGTGGGMTIKHKQVQTQSVAQRNCRLTFEAHFAVMRST